MKQEWRFGFKQFYTILYDPTHFCTIVNFIAILNTFIWFYTKPLLLQYLL